MFARGRSQCVGANRSARVPLIRAARQSGLTLRAIAEITGLSYARIYQIEKEAKDYG